MSARTATPLPRRFSRRRDALRPALLFASMLLLLLGVALGAIIVLVVWVTTPEQLFVGQLADAATLVQGGDSLASVTQMIRREALTAAALLSAGIAGLIAAHFVERSGRCYQSPLPLT